MDLTPADLEDLDRAVSLLERPSLIAKLSNLVGRPVELALAALPKGVSDKVAVAVSASLQKAVAVAVSSLRPTEKQAAWSKSHKLTVAVTGGVGGFFGLPGLPVELPITTTVMMRSIADIARSEGEDLTKVDARLACLEVFAMGGSSKQDDAAEAGYFAVRATLARAVNEAAKYLAEKAVIEEGAPVMARLIATLAARFGPVVAEKVMAQGVPVLGALGGATLNLLFIDHYQDMARGHFIVRRLEREYGKAAVKEKYIAIRN